MITMNIGIEGNTDVATLVGTGIAKGLLLALRATNRQIAGTVFVNDDCKTFEPENPRGKFHVYINADVNMSGDGIVKVLSTLQPDYQWRASKIGDNTFSLIARPHDWNYRVWCERKWMWDTFMDGTAWYLNKTHEPWRDAS